MEAPALLRILRSELLRRGLPRAYVERVTGELADHADDMAAEAGRTTPTTATPAMRPQLVEQLGDPVRLADGLSLAFQQRTFLGRHPCWTFVALPAGAMSAAWVAANLIIVLLVELLLRRGGGMPSDARRWVAALATGMLAYGMTYGMPVLLCWWALRKVRQTTRVHVGLGDNRGARAREFHLSHFPVSHRRRAFWNRLLRPSALCLHRSPF